MLFIPCIDKNDVKYNGLCSFETCAWIKAHSLKFGFTV